MTGVSMRFGLLAAAGVLAFAGLASRSTHAIPAKLKEPWKTGYWVWAGDAPVAATFTPQILYVEAPATRWPRNLPQAEQYSRRSADRAGHGVDARGRRSHRRALQKARRGCRSRRPHRRASDRLRLPHAFTRVLRHVSRA